MSRDVMLEALIEQHGQFCPCGIDLTRNGCYRCLHAMGAVWHYNPDARCPACGSHVPLDGHVCTHTRTEER